MTALMGLSSNSQIKTLALLPVLTHLDVIPRPDNVLEQLALLLEARLQDI